VVGSGTLLGYYQSFGGCWVFDSDTTVLFDFGTLVFEIANMVIDTDTFFYIGTLEVLYWYSGVGTDTLMFYFGILLWFILVIIIFYTVLWGLILILL
jgi:hypothetical protein